MHGLRELCMGIAMAFIEYLVVAWGYCTDIRRLCVYATCT